MYWTAEQFTTFVNKNKFVTGYTLGAVRVTKNANGPAHCNLQVTAYAVSSQIVVTRTSDFFWCGNIKEATEGLDFAPWNLLGVILMNDSKTVRFGTGTLQPIISAEFGTGTKNNIVIAPENLGAVLHDARHDTLYSNALYK